MKQKNSKKSMKGRLIQNGIKIGICAGAAVGANLVGGALESAVADAVGRVADNPQIVDFARSSMDLLQTGATCFIPYVIADKYMRGRGDSKLARYAVQLPAAVFGFVGAAKDIGNMIPADEMKKAYDSFLDYIGSWKYILPACLPFVGDIKRALNKKRE